MGRLCLVAVLFFMACIHVQAHKAEHELSGKVFFLKDTLKNTEPVTDSNTTHARKHRLVAALLAFPLGVFGLHRMYLGSSAGIPIAYIATFGGGFGVLPFIDFVLILINKDVNNYAHNPHIFMWSKPKNKKK